MKLVCKNKNSPPLIIHTLSRAKNIKTTFAINLITSLLFFPAYAQIINPGQTITVNANSQMVDWQVKGGTLYVESGGKTDRILVSAGGLLNMNGGAATLKQTTGTLQTVSATTGSTAIINDSTIVNDNTSGIGLGTISGAQMTVTNTSVTSASRGFTIDGTGSALFLSDTTIVGKDDGKSGNFSGGGGGTVFDGALYATNSSLTGDRYGLMLLLNYEDSTPTAVLDNSQVTGGSSSAIIIGVPSNSYDKGLVRLDINNGTTLYSGTDTIISVINGNTAAISVDNSQLNGNIIADDTAYIDASFSNNASLRGDMQNVNTLSLDDSQIDGDLSMSESGLGHVQLANNAEIRGNIDHIVQFSADNSRLTGNLNADTNSVSSVSLTSNSNITGDLTNIAQLSLDSSTLNGSQTAGISQNATTSLTNGSNITGDLTNIAQLTLDSSTLNGNQTADSSQNATTSLTNGSNITGDLTNIAQLTLDNSTLDGNQTADSSQNATTSLTNGSNITGDLTNIAQLTLDNSTLNGNQTADISQNATTSLIKGSNISGDLTNIAQLTLDNSTLDGNQTADISQNATTSLTNGSNITGDLTNIAQLSLDNSTLVGNQTADISQDAATSLTNGSNISGNLTNIAHVTLTNASTLDGDLSADSGQDAETSLASGSRITGNLTNIAHLSLDDSILVGNQTADISQNATTSLTNGSNISGDLTNIAQLTIDSSTLDGNVHADQAGFSQVTLNNNALLNGDVSQIAALTLNQSQLNGNVDGSGYDNAVVSLTNNALINGDLSAIHTLSLVNSQLTGDVSADGSAGSSVTLSDYALLRGNLQNYDNVTINDNAQWTLTQSASVGNLNLQDGLVDLNSTGNNDQTLTMDTLSGAGTFILRTNIAALTGDQVIVNGEAEGEHVLDITNTGTEPGHNAALTVVKTAGGDGTFSVKNGVVDAGVYEYKLSHESNDWVLMKTDDITPSTKTILSLVNATPNVWSGELHTVRSRLGNLHTGNNHDGGVWAQYLGREANVSPRAGVSYKQRQYGLAIGADKALEVQTGSLLVGAFTGYSDNRITANYGNGNIDSYFIGGYATWLADSGWFLDTVLKGNQFHHVGDAQMSDGVHAKSHYNSYGFGISSELGKNIKFTQGWFIEPSLQLSSLWISSVDYQLDNGMKASNDTTRSYQAAVNLVAGKDITLRNGMALEPYTKLAYQYEFAKNNDVRINDTRFTNDMSGGNAVYGLGLNAQISNNAYIYTDVNYEKGSKYESPWSANLGVRINW